MEEQFDRVIDVNLRAPWLLSQCFARRLIEKRRQLEQAQQEAALSASIVNISSIVGKTGNFGQTNYSAAKAGLIGLTKSCAKELARHNIRCNAVNPGFIETEMALAVPEKVLDKFKERIPMGRLGDPQEVADAIAFLASDNSSYLTGHVLEVTG